MIRTAEPRGVPAIAEIWCSGWRGGHLGFVPDALVAVRTDESFDCRAALRVGDTTVAVIDGRVAGFVARRFYERRGRSDTGPFDYAAACDDGPIDLHTEMKGRTREPPRTRPRSRARLPRAHHPPRPPFEP